MNGSMMRMCTELKMMIYPILCTWVPMKKRERGMCYTWPMIVHVCGQTLLLKQWVLYSCWNIKLVLRILILFFCLYLLYNFKFQLIVVQVLMQWSFHLLFDLYLHYIGDNLSNHWRVAEIIFMLEGFCSLFTCRRWMVPFSGSFIPEIPTVKSKDGWGMLRCFHSYATQSMKETTISELKSQDNILLHHFHSYADSVFQNLYDMWYHKWLTAEAGKRIKNLHIILAIKSDFKQSCRSAINGILLTEFLSLWKM